MELFLLLIPAVFLPVGLSIVGIWWLFSKNDAKAEESTNDDWADGGA
ncbi:MAG: hypothetical protein WBM41_00095 [Arenicellales bacterium]